MYKIVCRDTATAESYSNFVVASTPELAIAAMMTEMMSNDGINCDSPEVSNVASDVIVGS